MRIKWAPRAIQHDTPVVKAAVQYEAALRRFRESPGPGTEDALDYAHNNMMHTMEQCELEAGLAVMHYYRGTGPDDS